MSTTQVLYDGKRIIPAARLEYSRNFNQLPNGEIIGQVYNISFSSTILAHKGSPTSSGTFWTANDYPPDESISSDARLSSILKKQEKLRELFSKTNIGKKFEVIPENSQNSIWFFPSSIEITFNEGPWFQECEYNVSMVADRIYPNVDGNISQNIESASETWSIEPNEQSVSFNSPFTYRVSHSLSAKGRPTFNSGVLNNSVTEAKNWITQRLGLDSTILSGYNNLSNLGAYNHILSETINESDGSYSVNENWLFASGNVIEEYTVTSQNGLDGISQVSIQGNIQGLESRTLTNISGYKWDNASGYFNLIQPSLVTRAQSISNITLNPIPLSTSVGRNPLQGTINYAYEYNNRPTSFISGALSERIIVTYNDWNHKIATVPVIGRARGPVLQSLGTSDATSLGLSIDFNLGPKSGPTLEYSDFIFPLNLISGIINMIDPINNGAVKSFRGQPQLSWEPITGIASYNVEWIYE